MLRNPENTVGNILDKQSILYLSAIDEDGFPSTKAMLNARKRDGISVIYFSTNTSSKHVAQLQKNPKSCVYFCDRRFFRGVMLRGVVEVLLDQKSREMLWQKGDERYYPLGVTDPDYCVLRFRTESGRYYANYKSEDFTV